MRDALQVQSLPAAARTGVPAVRTPRGHDVEVVVVEWAPARSARPPPPPSPPCYGSGPATQVWAPHAEPARQPPAASFCRVAVDQPCGRRRWSPRSCRRCAASSAGTGQALPIAPRRAPAGGCRARAGRCWSGRPRSGGRHRASHGVDQRGLVRGHRPGARRCDPCCCRTPGRRRGRSSSRRSAGGARTRAAPAGCAADRRLVQARAARRCPAGCAAARCRARPWRYASGSTRRRT